MSISNKSCTYQVSLRIESFDSIRVEILKGFLIDLGISENLFVECNEWPYTYLSVYFTSRIKAQNMLRQLRRFRLRQVVIRLKILKKSDWQAKWKKDFKPFALTQTITVVPMWLKKEYNPRGKTPVYIDTSLAFGTGMHPTTRFMSMFVERCANHCSRFLDLGTGTGILSIIAAKNGIHDIMAVDISRSAVEVAKANCRENDCSWIKVKVIDAAKLKTNHPYDFVCANLITQDLVEMAEEIISLVRPGKYLAVSGISISSYKFFRKNYSRYPLRCIKIEKGDGWAGVLYKKL